MSIFRKFENGVETAFDKAAGAVFSAPIEPAQIAKRAEKQMKANKLVGAGRQYAPTLYNVLVNRSDDKRLFGFYPTMASEIENYLMSRGTDAGLEFDGRPLVRFLVDEKLKSGRFDVIAENVSAPVIKQLREEEMVYYGIAEKPKPEPYNALNNFVENYGDNHGNNYNSYNSYNRYSSSDSYNSDDSYNNYGDNYDENLESEQDEQDSLRQDSFKRHKVKLPLVSPVDTNSVAASAAANEFLAANAMPNVLAKSAPRSSQNAAPNTISSPVSIPTSNVATNAAARTVSPGAKVDGVPALGKAHLYNQNNGRDYPLLYRAMICGRDCACDIPLDDANASRQHARFEQNAAGTWKIVDLGSTNGTQINGRINARALLRNGDIITIGMTVLEFWEQ